MQDGTSPYHKSYKEGDIKWVSAREIVDFWDAYKAEEEPILRERAKREYNSKRERARGNIVSSVIGNAFAERGIPYGGIDSYNRIWLPIQNVLDWLGISEDEIDRAIDRTVGPDPTISDASTPYSGSGGSF